MSYTLAEKNEAIRLHSVLQNYEKVVQILGYPSSKTLTKWVREFRSKNPYQALTLSKEYLNHWAEDNPEDGLNQKDESLNKA